MATRIDPPTLGSEPYELYKQELLAWREVTDLRKEKQGVVIALSLPKNDRTQIREKVFEQISIDDLKKEDGLDALIAFLDKHLKKDDLADSLEKFGEFEDFQRKDGMSISEYIASFDSRYRKIEKLKMTLPPEILAFKLLRKANISKDETLLVLTGMNYSNKPTLYEEAMNSLKKFKGDLTAGNGSSSSGIKLEPAFLAENEEALLAAGYVKQSRGGKIGKKGKWGYSHGSQAQQERQMNPTGPDGKTLTCRCCGSFRHLVAKCPHSWENTAKTNMQQKQARVNIAEDEHVVLFTGYHKGDIIQLGIDARNCAVLDSACSSTVCGESWLENYLNSLNEKDRRKIKQTVGQRTFKFGGGERLKSKGEYCVPAVIAGKDVIITTDVVQSDIPLLLSRRAMKRAGVKMDLESDTAMIFGKDVALNLTTSGHYCIPIDRAEKIPVEEVFSVDFGEMGSHDRYKILQKLHRQFAHPPLKKLKSLLEDAGHWKDEWQEILEDIEVNLGESGCIDVNDILDTCADPNAICGSDGECLCDTDYYDDNGNTTLGTCVRKVTLGGVCSMLVTDSCSDPHADCAADSICKCRSDYYDNKSGSCKIRIDLDASCQTNVAVTTDQCKDKNAQCDGTSRKCECNAGYFKQETGTAKFCEPNKPLGDGCDTGTTEIQCSDPDAACLTNGSDYICTCNLGYYDDNGFDSGGNCQNISKLMVSAVSVSNIHTKGFTVSWNAPSDKEHVSEYRVSWTPNAGQINIDRASTTASILNLTPGAVYKVTITTINDMTQVSRERMVSTSKTQSTKAGIPGAINTTTSELNAMDKTITLMWAASEGQVSIYRVQVFDGTDEKTNISVTSASANISFDDMKNGQRYTVNITAESLPFDGDNTVDSDTHTEVIKTVVMPPTVPQGFACSQSSDIYIILAWEVPQFPNGDLVQYYIEVYLTVTNTKSKTSQTITPVTEFKVEDLDPGTYYTFYIYTENEMFQSDDYAMTACKTSDRVSESPADITVSNITNRSMVVSWKKPINSYGEILGYVLQLRNDSDVCVKEVITKCTDCTGMLNDTDLLSNCSDSTAIDLPKTNMLEPEQEPQLIEDLLPYSNYSITIVAVNEKGKGHPVETTNATLEEAPVKPENVDVTGITAKSFIVTWSKGPVRPGRTSYVVKVTGTDPVAPREHSVLGYDQESYTVEGLEEFWVYSVKVTAFTSVGQAESDVSDSIKTLPAAPGQVDKFTIYTGDNGTTYRNLKVGWKIPTILERNSEITGYTIKYNDTTENITTSLLAAEAEEKEYSETFTVVPEYFYSITVFARNSEHNGTETKITLQAPAGVPENTVEKDGNEAVAVERVSAISQTGFQVPIRRDFFSDITNGEPQDHGVIGCAICDFESLENMSLEKFKTGLPTWAVAKKSNYPNWRMTEHGNWLSKHEPARKKRAVEDEVIFSAGADDCSTVQEDQYCNGPLAADTEYKIMLVVCTNGGCLRSNPYGPFRTQPIPPPDDNTGAIAGGAAGGAVAALAVIGVVGFILYRRRSQPKGTTKHVEHTPLHPDIQRKRPVSLQDFPQQVARLHKDSNLLFSAEYDDLKTLSPAHPTTAADAEDNRLKNRYINILPFDHTRVKLLQRNDDESDFINANYLPGYKSQREYIGCQGPIPATIDDFWRMVWEQNVAVIVILTLCKEGNKIKCEPYWPEEVGDPKQYGDITVEVKTISNIKFYDYRIFNLSYSDQKRTIKHFHFLSWLDFQANITHDTILDFISQVRTHVQPPDTAGPMIVHCSAGVGRTGTYICLDYLQQFIDEHDFSAEVDIFDMVLKLRENRPHMVQTEQQYVFIHDCLNEMLERKRRALMEQDNIYVNQAFDQEQEENLYQNTEHLYQNVSISGGQPQNLQNTEL